MGSEDVWVETSGETAHGTAGLVDLREEEGGGGGRRSGTRSEGALRGLWEVLVPGTILAAGWGKGGGLDGRRGGDPQGERAMGLIGAMGFAEMRKQKGQ